MRAKQSFAIYGSILALVLSQSPVSTQADSCFVKRVLSTLRAADGNALTPTQIRFIDETKKTGRVFSHEAFWRLIESDPSHAAVLFENWYAHVPESELQALKAIRSRWGKFGNLLLDPGIAQFSKEFDSFLENTKPGKLSLFDLRQEFSKHMGTETVWHGRLLNKDEAADVAKQGLRSNFAYVPEYKAGTVDKHLFYLFFKTERSGWTPNSIYGELTDRLQKITEYNLYSSYSKWIEPTHLGAWTPNNKVGLARNRPGDFYLFEVELPRIDVVRRCSIFPGLRTAGVHGDHYSTTGINNQRWSVPLDNQDLEVFVQYASPTQIKKTIQYKDLPPKWSIDYGP